MFKIFIIFYKNFIRSNERNNYCVNVGLNATCPDKDKTTLRCFSRKRPIGPGAIFETEWTDPNLVILPGDKIKCTVYCRTRQSNVVQKKNCHLGLFEVRSNMGQITESTEMEDNSSFSFYYHAAITDWKSINEKNNSDIITVSINNIGYENVNRSIINNGKQYLEFPISPTKISTLKCNTNFVKFRSKIDCEILPQKEEDVLIKATPFMFDVGLSKGSNILYGNFSRGGYLSISTANENKGNLKFQYEGGLKEGCNYITAIISKNIPNSNDVGEQIVNSPFIVCTVGGNEVFLRGYSVYFIPLFILMTIEVLKTLKFF